MILKLDIDKIVRAFIRIAEIIDAGHIRQNMGIVSQLAIYDVDYPQIKSDIPSGIEENGVILFDPLNYKTQWGYYESPKCQIALS
jgi:hypothetical protein